MTKSEIIQKLYAIEAVKLGRFTLKSGITSPIYIDLRQIIAYPKLMHDIAMLIWDKVKHCSTDLLCGVPYTALPIATCISVQHDKPMLIVRKEAKAYGTKKQVEGQYQAGQTCLIIEDVVTSGSSVITVIEELQKLDIKVPYVAAFLDREQDGRTALTKLGCEFYSVITLSEIISELKQSGVKMPADLV